MIRAFRRRQDSKLKNLIDLTQYQDVIPAPTTTVIENNDVFYDTPSSSPDWLPTCDKDPVQFDRPSPSSSSSISSLVDSLDALENCRSILALTSEVAFFDSRYTRLDQSTSLYKSIWLQARNLKSQVFHYDSSLDDCTDSTSDIYVSSCSNDLPIVIDTGASNSISPEPTDFVDTIEKSDLPALKQVNGTTPVCGEGKVCWKIEDFNGTRRSITTQAYYVPSATIRLFSPQVYIGNNKTSCMVLDNSGLQLTLVCGTILYFPINKSNNLPFMLTQTQLDKGRKSHHSSLNLKISTNSAGLYNSGIEVHNSLIEHSVFNRDNLNLDPSQQELLK